MTHLLFRAAWLQDKDEGTNAHIVRLKIQNLQLRQLRQQHGLCYLIKIGIGKHKVMWEDEINPIKLKAELTAPDTLSWDCPLCQPYDIWESRLEVKENRRYLCKIVDPTYREGCADEEGVFMKCPCLTKGARRQALKFRRDSGPRNMPEQVRS